MSTEFAPGTRVIDTRTDDPATVLTVNYDGEPGSDGFGVSVEYDDDPGVPVSTGTDHFAPA